MTLPDPVKIREGDAKEDAPLSEFQQEMLQLAAVLKGEDILTSYPKKIGKQMTVKQGTAYMENAVKTFLEAGYAAKKMGVNEEQIVKMMPSLSTRLSNPKVWYLQSVKMESKIQDMNCIYYVGS